MIRRISLLCSAAALWVSFVSAAEVNTAPATAPRTARQLALAVAFDARGQVHAKACDKDPCTIDGGTTIAVPDDMAKLATSARLRVVHVGDERAVVVVEIPDSGVGHGWAAVVAAPAANGAPLVPFSGYTGLTEGVEGERTGPMVLVQNDAVYVGVQREGQELCGRPAILSPTVLDPATLTLKPAKLQRISEAEQAAAASIDAKPVDGPRLPLLLHALWATSAADGAPPSALTDGNDETVWAEGRGGVGRGEFAVLDAPSAVPLSAFEVVLPPRAAATHVELPTNVFIATEHELYRANFPAASSPPKSARYEIALPAAVHTSCVAVVLDHAGATERDARVSIAEVSARPSVGATVPELVSSLHGGGPDAEAAAAILRVSGPDAFFAVSAAFPTLDAGGRRVAFEVLDDAPCDIALQAYIEALSGTVEAEQLHARSALGRCEASAPSAFALALPKAAPAARGILADELATLSPAMAVDTMVKLLPTATKAERRAYRAVLARVAPSEAARPAFTTALTDAAASPSGTLDVLRALGETLPAFGPPAEQALARVAAADTSFRTRYLILGPAAELAEHEVAAADLLRRALTADTDPHVRVHAAEVLKDPRPFADDLRRSVADSEVRVREAALHALSRRGSDAALPVVVERLRKDSWPLVRSAAAEALGGFGADKTADAALGDALDDDSEEVRRAVLGSIGARHAVVNAPLVRARLADPDELAIVRADAAVTLGALCDVASVDALTKSAAAFISPTADDDSRLVARGALAALAYSAPERPRGTLGEAQRKRVSSARSKAR